MDALFRAMADTGIVDRMNDDDTFSPKIILGVVAHPDDMEFCAAGSVAAWTKQGAEVYYLILTSGGKGTEDPDLTPDQLQQARQDEQREAARILGVKDVFFGEYNDCELTVSYEVKRDIARIIRKVQPDTVITLDPTFVYSTEHGIINHSDHRAAGQATLDAVYPLARDHLAFPELLEEGLTPHKTPTVLLINFDKANFFVDTTDTMDAKLAALAAHKSQFPDLQAASERVKSFGKASGAFTGSTYAEGFLRIDIV